MKSKSMRQGTPRPQKQHWMAALGFMRTHAPGISRAWNLPIDDGYILVTDIGGFDLPGPGEPATAYVFSTGDEVLEFVEYLKDSRALFEWVRSARRRSRWRSNGGINR